MIDRRFILAGGLAVVAAVVVLVIANRSQEPNRASPVAASAQPGGKPYRIGLLGMSDPTPEAERKSSDFQQALVDLGYVEGRNVVFEYRYAAGDATKLPELAADLVGQKVDMIVTSGELAALAAKRATSTIPIIATELAMDPVKAGIVANLGRPEANVTGLATRSEELWSKRLAVFRQIVGRASRIVVLWNPDNPANQACVDEIKAASPSFGLQVRLVEIRDAAAIDGAFVGPPKEAPDAIAICWDSATLAHMKRIAELAMKQRLPTLAPVREYVDAGGLVSQGPPLSAHRRRAAYYVDKLLKGAKPGALPVEQAAQFDLVINVATAKTIGVTPPDAVLLLADDLIR